MTSKRIVFIDSRVTNYQSLIDSLTEPAEVFVLDSRSYGLAQMTSSIVFVDASAIAWVASRLAGVVKMFDSTDQTRIVDKFQ